jgi:hypothetical protein
MFWFRTRCQALEEALGNEGSWQDEDKCVAFGT